MCGARENKNVWWYLFTFWPNYAGEGPRWRGYALFARRWWRSEYVWHDSIGMYWHRAVTCRFFGHGKPQDISCPGEPPKVHCFDCERTIR
jgi:hypothetical protein